MKTKLLTSEFSLHLFAGIFLAVAACICFRSLTIHPTDVLVGVQDNGHNDTTNQFIAYKDYQYDRLQENGQTPYWNPYALTGIPWLGTPQSALFYPPNWIFLWFPSISIISWMLVFYHWWAGLGAYFLGRKYRLNWGSAIISGIAFLAAPYLIAKTGEGHYTTICLVSWFPWVFITYEHFVEGKKWAIPLMAILLSLCFFSGHVQEVYYLVLFLSASVIIESIFRWFKKRKLASTTDEIPPSTNRASQVSNGLIKGWVITGILTCGLVAIELIPVFIYTKQAVRAGGMLLESTQKGSLELLSGLQLIDPLILGGPDRYQRPDQFYWETICYFGCIPLLLAVMGMCFNFKKKTVIRLVLIGLVSFLAAFGPNLPIYPLFYKIIPGFSMFRNPARLLFICTFVISMLAGFGSQWIFTLFNSIVKQRARMVSYLGCLVGITGLAWLVFQNMKPVYIEVFPKTNLPLQLSTFFVSLLAIAISVLICSLTKKGAVISFLILSITCTWDLSNHAESILRTIPISSFRNESPITKFLKENLGEQRVLASQILLSDREAWSLGLNKVQGYDPVPLIRIGMYAAAEFPKQDAAMIMAGFIEPQLEKARKPLLDLMGVKYAILKTNQKVKIPEWKTISQGTLSLPFALRGSQPRKVPYTILENETPLPRAFVLGKVRPFDSSSNTVKELEKITPRQGVSLTNDLLPKGNRQTFRSAKFLENTPDKITIQAELEAPGYLVLTDIYYSGWEAKVDNQPIPIVPAYFSFRAVPLSAGTHEVIFSFTPPGLKVGKLISILTLVVLLVLFFKGLRTKT